jgi:hypothetical protein
MSLVNMYFDAQLLLLSHYLAAILTIKSRPGRIAGYLLAAFKDNPDYHRHKGQDKYFKKNIFPQSTIDRYY